MSTISVTEARAALPEVLDRVEAGEEITITRHGRAVAVLVRPDAIRSRRAAAAFDAADQLRDLLASARAAPLTTAPGLTEARVEELIDHVARGRSDR